MRPTPTTQTQKIANKIAQDQESDKSVSKPKQINPDRKTRSTSFNPSQAKGRVPTPSRLQKHPLPKPRKKKEAVRSLAPKPSAQTKSAAAAPTLGKTSQRVASTVHTAPKPSKQTISKEAIQSRLKRKSPWFDAIMSPITGGGVKIPDPIGTETGTYQHVENVSVTVNAQGVSGLRVVCPYVNGYLLSTASDGLNYQTTNNTSSVLNLGWGGTVGIPNDGFSFKQVPRLIKSNARSHRVVSASVLAQPEVSTLQDAGEMTAFVTPFDCQPFNVDYATYQFQYDSTLVPLNVHKPVVTRWYPLQAEAPLFDGQFPTGTDDGVNVSYQDFLDPNSTGQSNSLGVVPWEFGVVCSGMTASSGIVRFQIVVNYEFIPLMSTAMVSAAASPVDEVEENLVNNWVSESPITEVVSQKFASQAQQASLVSENSEPSGLGMLFNVVEEILPLAKTVGKIFI